MSTAAVFIALGGTGYAATTISGRSIRDHSIPARKLAPGSVLAGSVAIRSITKANVAPGAAARTAAYCRRGEKLLGGGGAFDQVIITGDIGNNGENRPFTEYTGAEAPNGRVIQSRPTILMNMLTGYFGDGSGSSDVDAYPDGKYVSPGETPARGRLQGWAYEAVNGASSVKTLHVYAICARAAG